MPDEYDRMTPDQRRALAHTASGPHNDAVPDPQYARMMRYHNADSERLRRAEVLKEALAIAANVDRPLTHFATGRDLDRFTGTKVRRLTDAPDPQHSPELVEPEPINVGALAARELYGLDDNGQPLPENQLTAAQHQARADRYAGNDSMDYPEEY